MKKTKIIIASVLKPLDDPRTLYKLAFSLRETNKYALNIIGFSSKKTPTLENIQFSTIFSKNRKHLSRILAPIKFFKNILFARPQIVIVTTYELLPMAIMAKFFRKFKLVYDLQENYSLNVRRNRTLPMVIRHLIAAYIQMAEGISGNFIDHYIFAERCYKKEFPHIHNFTIIENKSLGPKPRERFNGLQKHSPLTFLLSGTLTPVYGIEHAIIWFKKLQQEYPSAKLDIIGHVPLTSFGHKIHNLADAHPNIHVNISSLPVPYPMIESAMRKANVVLLPYCTLPSIKDKIPTKLYESIALQKPVFISPNPLWEKLISPYPAGLAIDFTKPEDAGSHLKQLLSLPLYNYIPGPEVLWEEEKKKLLRLISTLTK